MEWIEITAKTVEVAKAEALDQLGIAEDEAEFVIVEEPRPGLFNRLRGTARVRARVAPRTPRAKTERRNRRGRDDAKRGSRAKSGDKGNQSQSPKQKSRPDDKKTDTARSVRDEKDSSPSKRSTKSNKPKNVKSKEDKGNNMTMTLDDQVAATETFLTGLLEAVGFDGTVVTERTDEANAHVNIEGPDLGLLIGPRGDTMNAIQDLARINLQKQAAGSWEGHVHVDVNGYRAKRRAALVAFVEKIAADVRESGTAKALEPMSSSDRKIVHDTVNGIDGVHTSSEGHEPRRWVKISPDES